MAFNFLSTFFETETNYIHELPVHFWSLVILSTVVWWLIYSLLSEHLLLSPYYTRLVKSNCTDSEWRDIKSRLVSNIHAIYSCSIAIYFYRNDPQFQTWDLLYTNDGIILAATGTLGYFLYDYMLIMTDFENLGGVNMFIHHICVVGCFLGMCYYRIYHILIIAFCLSEITTPFVNARLLLLKMQLKDSVAYTINGLFMFLGFALFRFSLVIMIPYVMWQQRDTVRRMATFTNIVSLLGFIGMSMLNTMWTYKILMGLIKVLNHGSEDSAEVTEHHTTADTGVSLSVTSSNQTKRSFKRKSSPPSIVSPPPTQARRSARWVTGKNNQPKPILSHA